MSKRQIVLRHPSSNRRQPLLRTQGSSVSSAAAGGSSRRLAEVAGGTAADCAAVCCCCPCGLVNLVVLAVYKVPAALCRRALRSRRRRRAPPPLPAERQVYPVAALDLNDVNKKDKDVEELEKEMWERFYGTGFWRSPSQREPLPLPLTFPGSSANTISTVSSATS